MPSSSKKEIWPLMNADKCGSKTNRSSAFIRVHPRLKILFLSALFFGVAFGQVVPVVTVCEALQDRELYNGKAIVVVGRLASTDEGSWIGEDCERKIVTDGYTWANIISTTYARSQVEPPPGLPKEFKWDTGLLTNKLKDVQKTTKLEVLKEYNYSDRWVAIFGRFETRSPLQAVSGGRGQLMGYGFGHLNSAPAQLISGEKGFHELKAK
jgi:hypothetical protein